MLSIKTLPLRKLRGYAARSAAVALFAFFTAAVLFGGTLLTSSARNSLHTVQARLGADIMVTPESAKNDFDAQTALIKAEPASFYMDAAALETIRATEGVERASPQLFLASAKAGCCSARLQMIAFDPETDFTIRPWIEDTDTLGEMGLMDVVIGSNVSWTSASQGDVIRFYDSDCRVIGQFAATGSTLDSAVYMNFDNPLLAKGFIILCKSKKSGVTKYFARHEEGNRIRLVKFSDSAARFNYAEAVDTFESLKRTNKAFIYTMCPAFKGRVHFTDIDKMLESGKVARAVAISDKLKWMNR